MITKTQAKNRISQLITLDDQTDSIHSRYNARLLQYISSHLSRFYEHYADENGLDLSTASQQVNSWDLQQWNNAVNQTNMNNWPIPAKQRVIAYAASAHINKAHLLTALVALGMISNTVLTQRHIEKRLVRDGSDQINHLHDLMHLSPGISRNGKKIVINSRDNPKWLKNLWTDTDNLANDTELLINKKIRRGLTMPGLDKMLTYHANPKYANPSQSIMDRVAELVPDADRITRTESASELNLINKTIYSKCGIRTVDFVTMPGACPICIGIEGDNPYSIMSYPNIPVHPNCRCMIKPHDNDLITPSMLF